MNKTRKHSFTALLITLAALLVLVLSLGIFCACGDTKDNADATWFYGATAPESELGKSGDFYFDTETLTAYTKTADGQWVPADLYKGTGEPDAQQGKAGDLYLDTESGKLYQKTEDGWGTPVLTLKGKDGRDGVMWFSGNKDPNTYEEGDETLKDALPGDFYLNTDGFDVYQLGEDGKTWTHLGTLKGDPGKDADNPTQFFDGDGAPSEDITAKAKKGDVYLGRFKGSDDKGAGYRLYRYDGTKWDIIMESMYENRLDIYTYEELAAFAAKVSEGTDYKGKEVHLKTDIDFSKLQTASIQLFDLGDSEPWSPIGTVEHPFRGTFDGEGHTIENFAVTTSTSGARIGFFGKIENATIEHLHFENAQVEASGKDSVGAVVVGEAAGSIEVNDVTVKASSVTASDGATAGGLVGTAQGDIIVQDAAVESSVTASDGATAGGLVGSLTGSADAKVTVDGSSFEGSGAEGLIGDQGEVKDVTVTDSSITDEEGNTQEWDETGRTVYCISAAQQLIDLVNSGAVLPDNKILLTEDLDFTNATPAGKAYMTKDCLFEIDGKDGDEVHTISGLKYALFLYVKGGSYLHDFTIELDVKSTSGNTLERGAIAENIYISDVNDTVTVENVIATGTANNMRAPFFDESGADGSTGTLNFINCRNEAELTGSWSISKMAGFLNLPDKWNVNFTNCVNKGNLTGEPSNPVMGGFIAYAQGNGSNTITFTNCRNEGNVAHTVAFGGDPDVGGFVGKAQGPTNIVFTDCVNIGTVSCDGASTISIGGFIGHANGSVTFNGTNVNGEYTVDGDTMTPVEGKGDIRIETSSGTVRAGAFIGFPDNGTKININGTLVNAGNVIVEQITTRTNSISIYAGGLIGQTNTTVTFADDCRYINLGKVEATVKNAAGSVVYLGGVVGYISGDAYTLGTATGYNAGTLTATNADTIYTGSFAGCVGASTGLTEEGLTGFEDKSGTEKKIGHSA